MLFVNANTVTLITYHLQLEVKVSTTIHSECDVIAIFSCYRMEFVQQKHLI